MKQLNNFTDFMTAIHKHEVDLPTYMTPNNFDTAREEFLANPELEKPNFVYDPYDFTENLRELEEIRWQFSEVPAAGIHASQRAIIAQYLKTVQAKLDTLTMMQTYRSNERGAKKAVCNAATLGVRQGNLDLNRVPEIPTYEYLLNNPTVKTLGFTPKPETIQKFRELTEQKWSKSFARIDMEESEYTPQEVCDLVNTVIWEDFGFETDFRAEVDEKKALMNVDQTRHVLDIPAKRVNGKFSPQTIRDKVLGHELFGHVYRAAYMQAKHPELSIPLPGYDTFEEGVTKCMEQALNGKCEILGADSYVICGLAYCDSLTFRGAFDSFCEYKVAKNGGKELSPKAINTIFSRTARAFRGTGEVSWTASTVYFNGPAKVWPFIEANIDEPEKLWHLLFESGKTDPTLSSHQNLLRLYE